MAQAADFIVIGAGIAGASAAHWLAQALGNTGRVLLLEREAQPGYHSTGRSAALFMESYGPPQVRALSGASRAFFEQPPDGFCEAPLLGARGALMVAAHEQAQALQAHWELLRALSPSGRLLDAAETQALVPALRRERLLGGVYEPDAADIDVHALLQGYLRTLRRWGGELRCGMEVQALQRQQGQWHVTASGQAFTAPVLVNAAGAWADQLGELAGATRIGLEPRRRAAFTFALPEDVDASRWPATVGADEDWYIKPDAGLMLGSPANQDPVPPHDVRPEELDIALAIDRIEQMTTLQIRRPRSTWAGLRSFVPDGGLVGGWDARAEGFFWVAGQGGYGIQTSPAMGQACAALLCGQPLPEALTQRGLSEALLSPRRLVNA